MASGVMISPIPGGYRAAVTEVAATVRAVRGSGKRLVRPGRLHLVLPVVLLLGYTAVLATRGLTGPERFPVFKWELFSKVPPRVRDAYTVRLVEVRGRLLPEPVRFEQAAGLVAGPKSPVAYQVIQQFGRAQEAGRPLQADDARRRLEGQFLRDTGPGRYQLVKVRFDLLERIRCDCVISEEVIGEFTLD